MSTRELTARWLTRLLTIVFALIFVSLGAAMAAIVTLLLGIYFETWRDLTPRQVWRR